MFKKILFTTLILTILISMSFAAAAQEEVQKAKTPSEQFSEALNDYNQENYSLAAEKFNNLLEDENLDDDLKFSVLYYSTMTAVQRYQTAEAIKSLEEMNELGFQSANLNWKIGELFLNKNNQFDSADFEEALAYLKKAAELGLKERAFKRDLAYAYRENQELEKAENLYKEIIAENPSADDYLNLAKIKEIDNQLNEAVEYYESALELNGTQSSLYLNLANLYQKLENYNSAVSIFKQGIKNRDNFAPYYIGLGESYIKLNNYEEAKKALQKAVEINENSYYGYFLLANIAKEEKNYSEALNYYKESLKYNPDYVEAYLAEGRLYLEREEYYRAISRFSLAVEKNPDYADSHYYLAIAYYNADMLEAARAELRKTLHINDNYPNARDILDEIEKELNID